MDHQDQKESKFMKTFASILFFFLCLFLYTKFIGPFPFAVNSVQTTQNNLFQVTGQGSVSAIPDTAQVTFGVTKQAPTVQDAQQQVNLVSAKMQDAIKKLGISTKDMSTTDYNVNPLYTNGSTISSYSVTQTIQLKVQPIEKINQVIDAATANGANIVGQVTFGFTDTKLQQLEDEARKSAVAKAKTKAQSLAQASGVRLGTIINIEENNPQSPIVMPLGGGLGAKAESAPTQISPGTSTVTSTITLSYQIY